MVVIVLPAIGRLLAALSRSAACGKRIKIGPSDFNGPWTTFERTWCMRANLQQSPHSSHRDGGTTKASSRSATKIGNLKHEIPWHPSAAEGWYLYRLSACDSNKV